MTATTHRPAPVVASTDHQRPATDSLAGTGTMLRLVLRRNRIRLAMWWVVLVGLFAYVTAYYKDILATQAALDDFAAVSNVPSIKALTGLAAAPNTLGGAVWTKIWMSCALSLALGVVFLVTRNGRADEEVGRTELLRSRMLGVHAYSTASWVVNAALCVAVGTGVALVSATGGLDPVGTGITGSLIVSASMTGVGLVGVGIGAVVGQVTSTSRGANALGSIILGACYMLRMVGDLASGSLIWASPIGWGQAMQPWGADRWWPLGLLILLAAALLALAGWLEARRDLGSGLFPERRGRGSAPAWYATPLGLGLRLQRGPIIGWTVTIVISALLFGSVVKAMTDLMADAGGVAADLIRGNGVDALLSLLVVLIAMITTAFAIQSAVSLRADEASGIIEPQLTGAMSRTHWATHRLLIPAVGSAILLLVGGAAMGIGYGSIKGDHSQIGRLALSALTYWPAVMVFIGIAVALFGWVPRQAITLAWGILVAMWFIVLIGDALHFPSWIQHVLPFSATPYVPYQQLTWSPLVIMTLVAGALIWTGLSRFGHRDVQPG